MNNIISYIEQCIEKYLILNNLEKFKLSIIINKPKIMSHGDFSTNIPFLIYKDMNKSLLDTANDMKNFFLDNYKDYFLNINVIKGFINFVVSNNFFPKIILDILKLKDNYGKSHKKNISYNIEMISANPTGLLHLGHARNAFIANSVSNILMYDGYDVKKEYYVNDSGIQIENLALTVYFYYLKICKKIPISKELPKNCYNGEVYNDLAKKIFNEFKNKFVSDEFSEIKIENIKINAFFKKESIKYFMDIIQKQLLDLNIQIDYFSYESSFYNEENLNKIIEILKQKDSIYYKDDATWLSSKKFGDDKDRVLIKSDKTYTYLLPDITSHYYRVIRTKASKYIDFFGADHHGYINRLLISLDLLGIDRNIFNIQIIQMVKIIANDKIQKMSKRAGNAILLKDLLKYFSASVIKYIFCSKSATVHLNFDFNKMILKNENNPVFYAQYASARCSSILNKLDSKFKFSVSFELLNDIKEKELILALDFFNRSINNASKNLAPYIICEYIQKITKLFHSYYNNFRILDEKDKKLSQQRITLVKAFSQVLKNAFNLIGIEFKEKMY